MYFNLQFTKTLCEMTVIDIVSWLMCTTKITIIIIKQKTTIVCWLQMSQRRKKRNYIFWNHTQNYLYSCVSNIYITSKALEIPIINIIFWLMYTTKITLFYMNEKLLLFVDFTCHGEGKIGMISFETTYKIISIHVFLTSASQANIEKCQ